MAITGVLGKACLTDKWINITLFLDLDLRLKMLVWALPARKLSVTSSLPMAAAHLSAVTSVVGSHVTGMGRPKDLWHWGETM